jgi:hypothetical protein
MGKKSYLTDNSKASVHDIVKGIDKDVERGEDILMFGFCVVMLSSTFAPIAPPVVVLPAVALTFALSASFARINYHKMEKKLATAIVELDGYEQVLIRPIANVFVERPMPPLTMSFNPLKNLMRTAKSLLGSLMLNPFWMPIFYVMGIQIHEEKNLIVLNKVICEVEQKLLARHLSDKALSK